MGGASCVAYLGHLPAPYQGPIHIGAGCLASGLDVAQSEALQGWELQDLVLRGHHVKLQDTPSQVFTLVGRLDSWEVGSHPCLQALGCPHLTARP